MKIDFESLKGYEFHAMTTVSKPMGTLVKCKPHGLIEFADRIDSIMEKDDRILIVKKDFLKELLSYKLGLLENIPKDEKVVEEQTKTIDSLIEATDEEYAIICNDHFIKVINVSF